MLRFYTLLTISVIIATVGLATNSASVVIGAMLIAPLMTPIMGLAVALVLGWWRNQVRLILFIGTAGLLVIGLAYLVLWLFQVPTETPAPDQVLARTHPALGDLAVALCAGLAAAYMLVRRESLSALPGVAIAVALVPPLCWAGILLYFGERDLVWNAILLFLTNASAIVLATSAMFLFMRIRPKSRTVSVDLKVLSSNAMALIIVAPIAIPLFHQTLEVFKGVREQTKAVVAVREWINNDAMQGLWVRGDKVNVDLLVSIPLGQFGPDETLTPRRWIPPEMPKAKLNEALNRGLGREVQLTLTGEFRFTD